MSRLLIVDDEERIRVILKKYAEFEGYDTDEAADGMEIITESDRINRAPTEWRLCSKCVQMITISS